MKKKGKKIDIFTIILIVLLLAGLSLLLYPSFANYWNTKLQAEAVSDYTSEVADLDDEEYERILNEAITYNQEVVPTLNARKSLTTSEEEVYNQTLRVSVTDVIGYIEIPSIHQTLAIYHGTSDDVLSSGVGHIEWSSLPVGGESTHCVLSGHRGLPSARIFTDLDQLDIGDTFMLRVLDEVLTYEVDQILIVEPDDLSALSIEEGKDLCTLVTCTPYGVNSHRLLVRGHRIDNIDDSIRITADALLIDSRVVAPFMAIPILIAMLLYVFGSNKKKHRRG